MEPCFASASWHEKALSPGQRKSARKSRESIFPVVKAVLNRVRETVRNPSLDAQTHASWRGTLGQRPGYPAVELEVLTIG